jgi:hypothetical protein
MFIQLQIGLPMEVKISSLYIRLPKLSVRDRKSLIGFEIPHFPSISDIFCPLLLDTPEKGAFQPKGQ